jgi:hypothetical protein
MGDTWVVSLEHMLDENGAIAAPKGPARKVSRAYRCDRSHGIEAGTYSALPEYQVRCRRRPGRKPCTGIIEADFDPEDYRIMWWCPVCDDCGYISNWQGFYVGSSRCWRGSLKQIIFHPPAKKYDQPIRYRPNRPRHPG